MEFGLEFRVFGFGVRGSALEVGCESWTHVSEEVSKTVHPNRSD